MSHRAILLAHAEITSIRSRKDKSVGLSVVTSELTPEHHAVLFDLHGINVKVLVESIDDPDHLAPVEVNSEKEVRGYSQRLYDVLFVWWKQQGEPGDFNVFRANHMEKFINHVKGKLDPF
jgi:hypothetical protein